MKDLFASQQEIEKTNKEIQRKLRQKEFLEVLGNIFYFTALLIVTMYACMIGVKS